MNILIIGLGSIGKKHVDAIIDLEPDSRIFAIRSNINAEKYKSVINISHYEILTEKIDFVIISNITSVHADTINKSLMLKCPLFIEKPVLESLTEGATLSKAINTLDIKTYIGCNLRFNPALGFIKKYLDQKMPRINEVNIYCGSYLPNWRPGRDYKTVYSANKEMGGGVHLDLIHELDYCTWLFGFPIKKSVIKEANSSLNINAFDYANFIFHYSFFCASIILNYYRKDSKRTLEIVTSNETISVDLIKNIVKNESTGVVMFDSNMKVVDTYKEQMKYFIDIVRQKKESMNNFDNAIKVLEMALYE